MYSYEMYPWELIKSVKDLSVSVKIVVHCKNIGADNFISYSRRLEKF